MCYTLPMKNERYQPIVHPDPILYHDEGVSKIDKNERMFYLLKHIFDGLARNFNDEVRDFAHHHFGGDFDALFAHIPLEGAEPELHKTHPSRSFLHMHQSYP